MRIMRPKGDIGTCRTLRRTRHISKEKPSKHLDSRRANILKHSMSDLGTVSHARIILKTCACSWHIAGFMRHHEALLMLPHSSRSRSHKDELAPISTHCLSYLVEYVLYSNLAPCSPL